MNTNKLAGVMVRPTYSKAVHNAAVRQETAKGQVWVILENIRVHGLEWAAAKWEAKGGNFDVFYYAVFGKWPTRKVGKEGRLQAATTARSNRNRNR